MLAGIRSKQNGRDLRQLLFGAFADGMASVGRDATADDILMKRSVVVLSSGGDEPVSDEGKDGHSIFAWNLAEGDGFGPELAARQHDLQRGAARRAEGVPAIAQVRIGHLRRSPAGWGLPVRTR